MKAGLWVASACALVLAACESTTLQRDGATTNNSLGSYALPKASLSVAVYYARVGETDGLIVAAETPKIVTGEILPITAKFGSWSKDKYSIEVDPKTGFLKKIGVNLDDRGPDVVREAAGSLGAVASLNPGFLAPIGKSGDGKESSVEKKSEIFQVAEAVFDPTDAASVRAANLGLWSDTLDYLAYREGADCRADRRQAIEDAKAIQDAVDGVSGAKKKAAKRKEMEKQIAARAPHASLCSQKDRLLPPVAGSLSPEERLALLATDRPFVAAPQALAAVPASSANKPAQPCESLEGICVRAAREFKVALKVPGGPAKWRTARLPATGHETLVNIDRAIMADKEMSLTFEDGTLGDRTIEQASAAENIAKLPKVGLDAAIDSLGKTTTALSNIIPVRIEYRALRRPDEKIPIEEGEEEAAEAGTATAAAGETTAAAATTTPAATPAAAPATTTVSVPGAAGATTITIVPAGSAPAKDPQKPAPADESGPKLWFASCAYGLICKGALDEQIIKTEVKGSGEIEAVSGAGQSQSQTSGVAGKTNETGKTAGTGKAPGASTEPECTAANLQDPKCKPVTG